jgi:hypothetical protein
MGLLEFFRKYRNKADTSPCSNIKTKSKLEQQQQQQMQNATGIRPIDLNVPA